MFTKHGLFKSRFLVFFATVLCSFWLPIVTARNLENSKNELGENIITGASSLSGNMNNQYKAAPASAYYTAKRNLRSMLMTPKNYQQKFHTKTPLNLDLMDFLLEDEDEDRSKRFDDYGHMRFGKRGGEEQFDDYGHMRFGRSV